MSLYDWLMKDNEQNYIRVVLILGSLAVLLSFGLAVILLFK